LAGAVVGAGIFVITGEQARSVAGPSILLSYVAAGFSSMLSVFIYTEFALEVPTAGKVIDHSHSINCQHTCNPSCLAA